MKWPFADGPLFCYRRISNECHSTSGYDLAVFGRSGERASATALRWLVTCFEKYNFDLASAHLGTIHESSRGPTRSNVLRPSTGKMGQRGGGALLPGEAERKRHVC